MGVATRQKYSGRRHLLDIIKLQRQRTVANDRKMMITTCQKIFPD